MKQLKLRQLTVTGRFRTIDKPQIVFSINFKKQSLINHINSKNKFYA